MHVSGTCDVCVDNESTTHSLDGIGIRQSTTSTMSPSHSLRLFFPFFRSIVIHIHVQHVECDSEDRRRERQYRVIEIYITTDRLKRRALMMCLNAFCGCYGGCIHSCHTIIIKCGTIDVVQPTNVMLRASYIRITSISFMSKVVSHTTSTTHHCIFLCL